MLQVVVNPETGLVLTPNRYKEGFSTFRLDDLTEVINNNFFDIKRRTVFITGENAKLEKLKLFAGKAFPGKIIRVESFTPFYTGQLPKRNFDTGELYLTNGRPTYYEFRYTQDMNAQDFWTEAHANVQSVPSATIGAPAPAPQITEPAAPAPAIESVVDPAVESQDPEAAPIVTAATTQVADTVVVEAPSAQFEFPEAPAQQ